MNTPDRFTSQASGDQRVIFDRITDGMIAFDMKMICTYVNRRAGELLGRTPENLIGKNYWEEFPEMKGTPLANAYVNALETQEATTFESYFQPLDRWFEHRLYPSQDGLTIFFADVTERKQREQILQDRERQYSALINNLPGAVFRVRNDPNYTVEYVSDKIAELTGYPADDFRENRRNFGDLMRPDDRDRVWRETREALEEHRPYEVTYRFIDAHGKEKWNWERGMGIFDANGELQAVEGFVQDITERKRAEEALHRSEEKFSIIFRKAPYAAALVNVSERVIEDVNEEHERLFELSREELVGKTPEMLDMVIEAEQRKRIADLIREQGFVANEQLTLQLRSGAKLDILLSANSVQIDGETYLLTIAKDITELKRKEEELRRSREQLRALASHLQNAIEEERARIAREIHDDIGQIFTAIKMDLSLLLRALEGVSERKVKTAAAEEIRALIGLLDGGVQSIRKIVRDLRPETLETMGLLAGIEWQAKEFTKRTKIDVSLSLPKKEPELDKQQAVALFRVVQEALTNVARHAEATKVKIEIATEAREVRRTSKEESHVKVRRTLETRVVISDNGKGITEEALHKPGSFGLLAMRERIAALGGELSISGKPGKGTRVEVVLKNKQ
ncbi:MAG TPA: PAS domain S-box protein [Bacteroidota bacterium]|nr:PAS domain S-box protein [Bacteroidota bacterium]